MADLLKLPVRNDDGDAHVVVETPRGSAAKLEYDPELQAFTLSKALILGLAYPYDWGFIPSTKGEDGDPLDVLILHDAATAPGLVLKCKIIGVLEVLQTEKGEKPIRNEIEKFFVATDELESKELKFLGWKGPKDGEKLIKRSAKVRRNGKS